MDWSSAARAGSESLANASGDDARTCGAGSGEWVELQQGNDVGQRLFGEARVVTLDGQLPQQLPTHEAQVTRTSLGLLENASSLYVTAGFPEPLGSSRTPRNCRTSSCMRTSCECDGGQLFGFRFRLSFSETTEGVAANGRHTCVFDIRKLLWALVGRAAVNIAAVAVGVGLLWWFICRT